MYFSLITKRLADLIILRTKVLHGTGTRSQNPRRNFALPPSPSLFLSVNDGENEKRTRLVVSVNDSGA